MSNETQPIQLTEEEQLEVSRESNYSVSSALGIITMFSGFVVMENATVNDMPLFFVGAVISSIGALANLRAGISADILKGEQEVLQRRLAQKEEQK
ncbi:MAG TPA: hypothetical protein VES68_01030 [Candidatus Sulfotelmatobacter sp.]|nr:hypothetical protein [Candidatus Sulfotelmatobacter sp.]